MQGEDRYEKLFQFVEWVKNKKYLEEKEIYCGSQALEFIEERAEKLIKELSQLPHPKGRGL